MRFLDPEQLGKLDAAAFRARRPYPWANPMGLLQEAAWRALLAALPPVEGFSPIFGKARRHGQQSHDRFVLEEAPGLALPEPWHGFLEELRGPEYRRFLAGLVGHDAFGLRFHWHYTPAGCSVSPHCDAREKLGSHVFYFNDPARWRPEWGGETLVLDDGGRFDRRSNPDFDDFDTQLAVDHVGNRSLLFCRRGNSWHGVRPLRCPQDELRRVFIVVIEARGLRARLHSWRQDRGVGRR